MTGIVFYLTQSFFFVQIYVERAFFFWLGRKDFLHANYHMTEYGIVGDFIVILLYRKKRNKFVSFNLLLMPGTV